MATGIRMGSRMGREGFLVIAVEASSVDVSTGGTPVLEMPEGSERVSRRNMRMAVFFGEPARLKWRRF